MRLNQIDFRDIGDLENFVTWGVNPMRVVTHHLDWIVEDRIKNEKDFETKEKVAYIVNEIYDKLDEMQEAVYRAIKELNGGHKEV